ncbi:MAG: oligoendopeptidase F [Lachnospiraceae bacterium]|nr:oligoendopeptidase F [Lachnospiraceae bacterium]
MEERLLSRAEVPKELTWDLSLIYENEDLMWQDADRFQKIVEEIKAMQGKLTDADAIVSCLHLYEKAEEIGDLIGEYTGLAVSVDRNDTQAQELSAKIEDLLIQAEADLSFINEEISGNPDDVLQEAIEKGGTVAGYLKEILRNKPHLLSKETEKVLAAYGNIMELPYTVYEQAKLADMRFDDFEVNGKRYPLGYSLFEDDYEYERDTEVRRAAAKAFAAKLRQYENTTAACYNAEVQREKITAEIRGFKDIYDRDLFNEHVTRDMYDRQIDVIMKELAPHMRKYAKLLQRIHHLDQMTFADLKIDVDPDYVPRVTIEESKEYIMKGLSIMGEDYQQMIREAYDKRWVDFAKNQGKSTGGFCASPYGKGSFILLSWNERMADVITLAHELGHAGHFRACNGAQGILDTRVSGYFVEAPSTMNELLMEHYLLKTSDDKRFLRWVYSCMIGNTYYHNFVTHLLEAAYQRKVYQIIQEGGSVYAETLSGLFKETLQEFWGDAVEINDDAALTWMRQPHYYMGLYSYEYSAGLTVATQVMKRIEKEGEKAVEDWKKVLAAGSTLEPIGLAALAGVDITTDAALKDTIAYIGEIIDHIIELTDELEKEA